MGKTKTAKAMVMEPKFRTKSFIPKRGAGSYRRWAHDKPSQRDVDNYMALMNDLSKTEAEWEEIENDIA